MNNKSAHFEKYSTAPLSRDYYGVRVIPDQVILYRWKVSHGPHLLPLVRTVKFADFNEEAQRPLRDEIQFVFGPSVLRYLELVTSEGINTLLTLPKGLIEKLVRYLSLKDVAKLLCVSQVSCEIFDSNPIWEILLKRARRSSELSEMEKELGESQGFKKLVKDQQIRKMARKTIKMMEEKSSRSQKTATSRSEKIVRSASVNLPKSTLIESKSPTKKQSTEGSKKSSEAMRSPSKVSSKEKRHDLPKKSMSEEKTLHFVERNMKEKQHAAGEGYISTGAIPKTKSRPRFRLGKFEFITEDNERAEPVAVLPKQKMRSATMQVVAADLGSEQLTRRKSSTPKSPRSIFTKSQAVTPEPIKSKTSIEKSSSIKRKSKSSSKSSNNLNQQLVSEKNTEECSDGSSGMSYLMKRYLEASDEVARKFSECEKMAQQQQQQQSSNNTRSSSTQADMKNQERKPQMKRMQKYGTPTEERPLSRGQPASGTNIFAKLKAFKKN